MIKLRSLHVRSVNIRRWHCFLAQRLSSSRAAQMHLASGGVPTSRNPLWAFAPGKASGRKSTCTHQDSLWLHLWQSRTQRAAALHLQNLIGKIKSWALPSLCKCSRLKKSTS